MRTDNNGPKRKAVSANWRDGQPRNIRVHNRPARTRAVRSRTSWSRKDYAIAGDVDTFGVCIDGKGQLDHSVRGSGGDDSVIDREAAACDAAVSTRNLDGKEQSLPDWW